LSPILRGPAAPALLALACLGAPATTPSHAQQPAGGAPPFSAGIQQPLEFRGAGRDEPEPDVDEVVLGWFGPGDPDHRAYGSLWRGATLALEEENAAGGYIPAAGPTTSSAAPRPRPFRLEAVWSESPWQAGIGALLRLLYERHAWALVGGVDGTTTHLALQVALKSHVTLVSPGSSDPSTDRANVPWLFSLAPSDADVAPAFAGALPELAGDGAFAVAASADHDGHAALVAFRRELGRRRLVPSAVVEYGASQPELEAAASRLVARAPRAVVVLGRAADTGAFVRVLRRAGHEGMIAAGTTRGDRAFAAAAAEAAAAVVVACEPAPGAAWDRFASAYGRRWGDVPDAPAARAYDAVHAVATAVRRAGLNRARIRDAVAALPPLDGASGNIEWDNTGRSVRDVRACTWPGARAPARTLNAER
jgi:branched-chain amino acid transport system substrate-binding protein